MSHKVLYLDNYYVTTKWIIVFIKADATQMFPGTADCMWEWAVAVLGLSTGGA